MNEPPNTRRLHSPRARCAAPIVLALTALFTAGCDIVQGFQSAGDTLFPEEATHLSTPGIRIVSGGYRDMRFATGGELFLLARSPEDDFAHLHAMRYSHPKPCTIPNVGRFSTTQEPSRRAALIAYLEGDARVGTLRFADTTCNSYDMQLEDASLPLLGDPARLRGPKRPGAPHRGSADGAQRAHHRRGRRVHPRRLREPAPGADTGKLKVFDHDWALQGIFGENVGGFGRLRQTLIFENTLTERGSGAMVTNLARLSVSTSDATRVEESTIAEDACIPAFPNDTWAIYRSPCQSTKLHAYNERTRKTFALPFEADPYYVIIQPAKDGAGDDPNKDPFWFFFLRDVDAAGFGTLFVRTPDRRELELGKRPHSRRSPSSSTRRDVWLRAGRHRPHHAYGDTHLVEPRRHDARARSRRAQGRKTHWVIDYDGVVGKLAVVSGDHVCRGRSRTRRSLRVHGRRRPIDALFNDYDGTSAKLSVFNGSLDALEDTPLDR